MGSVTDRGAVYLGRYVPFCWEGIAYGLPHTKLDSPIPIIAYDRH